MALKREKQDDNRGRRSNESIKRVAWITGTATLVGMTVIVIGVIGSGFDVKSKADSAFAYTEEAKKQALPTRMGRVEEDIKDLKPIPVKVEGIKGDFKVVMSQMQTVITQMQSLDTNIKEKFDKLDTNIKKRVETLGQTITNHILKEPRIKDRSREVEPYYGYESDTE